MVSPGKSVSGEKDFWKTELSKDVTATLVVGAASESARPDAVPVRLEVFVL